MYGGGANAAERYGFLLAHGPDFLDLSRRASSYVDRILRGAKPSELPVSLSTVFDVAIRESRSRYSMFRDLFSSANVSTEKYFCRNKMGSAELCARNLVGSGKWHDMCGDQGRRLTIFDAHEKQLNINASHLFRLPFRALYNTWEAVVGIA